MQVLKNSNGMKPLEGFKFGADPEVFVVDSNGEGVCPTFIPGTKEEPFKVPCGAVQRDGMAAEFNIDPATSFPEFNRNIETVMREMKKFLPKGHQFVIRPSIIFSEKVWDEAPDDAKELGCTPDFNAWNGGLNPTPLPTNQFMRCAGGHVHIGWTDNAQMDDAQHIMNCRDLVKQLDWYLGGWSILEDKDPFRRLLYGKAGACRYKSYGVEYRTLSNFWIADTKTRLLMWDRLQTAIHHMNEKFLPESGAAWNDRLINSINRSKPDAKMFSHINFPFKTINVAESTYF